jgi:hypothetical protein
MLSVIYAECHYAEYHKQDLYAKCHYAKCHYAECRYVECRGALSNINCSCFHKIGAFFGFG